jgi:nucleotide-binding universal stress UspA family protein
MYLCYNYIVGIKEWFLKKIKKHPLTEVDETIRVSTSRADYKEKKPEDILSEEHTMTFHQNTSATSKPEQQSSHITPKGEEEVVQVNSTQNGLSESQQTTGKIRTSVETKTVSLQRLSPEAIPKYSKILIPHDGSEISDKALAHAIYQSKISNAEIVILNVVEHFESKESSTVTATVKGEGRESDKTGRGNLEITMEGGVKQLIEEKIRLCKEAGVTSQVSYKIQTGKPVDEIVRLAEETNIDLIVMASSRITSPVMVHGSVTRKVMDGTKKPVLVIRE